MTNGERLDGSKGRRVQRIDKVFFSSPSEAASASAAKGRRTRKRHPQFYLWRKPTPYLVRKLPGKNCYTVKNYVNRRVFSKCTTKEKGTRQAKKLLDALMVKINNQNQKKK